VPAYCLRLYGHGRSVTPAPLTVLLEDDGCGGHTNLLDLQLPLPSHTTATVDTVALWPAGHPGPVWGLAASPGLDLHDADVLRVPARALRVPTA